MAKLLALTGRPTAVFCYNDMSALGALRTIRLGGVRVPEDISVVGFDDLFVASYTHPSLTTVRQPMRRMGVLAMESLLALMSGKQSADTIKVPAELIVRESTAAAHEARRDEHEPESPHAGNRPKHAYGTVMELETEQAGFEYLRFEASRLRAR